MQTGFAVSKKSFKKAVERNKIKRLMREGYRLQKIALTQKLIERKKCMAVFFIYTGSHLPTYEVISEKIKISLSRLEKIADEITPSHS